MTTLEENERQESDMSEELLYVRSDDKVMKSGSSHQPLSAKSLSPKMYDSVSQRGPELKTRMKSKMTREEIRKKMEKAEVEFKREELYNGVEELFKDHEGRNYLVLGQKIFVDASDNTDSEIEVLKKAITDLTFEHPCWGEKMPNACVPLELEIAELVAEGKQILSLKDVEELNAISKVSVLSPELLSYFLNFYHSLGKIVYFDTPQLKDFVIINPLLMVEVMRSFVTDILSEQRRYDTTTGSRLPVENFFVPCMVTERNTTSFMDKECTPERAICLVSFKGTIIPPALPNRLISACLSMWTVKQYEGRQLLFSGFIGLSFDKSHDIVVCVEGNKILLYIVHITSSGLIVPDIATGVKECIVITIERISDFYQSTIHAKRSQQSLFHIKYSCSKMQCFISETEALKTCEWKKEQCEQNCPGLSEDALNQIPSDIELLRFSMKCPSSKMFELVTYLGMPEEWEDIKHNYPNNIKLAKFLVLSNMKEKKIKFKALKEALTKMHISTDVLCQVRRVRKAETDIPVDYLDLVPTDEILETLAPQIGQVFFQLEQQLGYPLPIWKTYKVITPRLSSTE
ncbi:unnamed protein product [Mytilus edulis]|uniref:Uncharacterized protein n=1 Tax=Mytilus edulis TaxID=6550 RepID=A0A8S3U2U4_MYTED|nr:unnamed protein product [Mytilus edulis]